MTDKARLEKVALDIAIEKLKKQMENDKLNNSEDWKKAYLHKVDLYKQSLNRSRTYA